LQQSLTYTRLPLVALDVSIYPYSNSISGVAIKLKWIKISLNFKQISVCACV
jgi:hypothetical protein